MFKLKLKIKIKMKWHAGIFQEMQKIRHFRLMPKTPTLLAFSALDSNSGIFGTNSVTFGS
jgi:hypothetical protein